MAHLSIDTLKAALASFANPWAICAAFGTNGAKQEHPLDSWHESDQADFRRIATKGVENDSGELGKINSGWMA